MRIRPKHLLLGLVLTSCSSQLLKFEDKDFENQSEYHKEVKVIQLVPEATPTPAPVVTSDLSKPEKKVVKATPKKVVKKIPPAIRSNKTVNFKEAPSLKPGQSFSILMTYLGMTAGELIFSVKNPVILNDRKSYHFQVEARTLKIFEMIYKVNNVVNTYADYETLVPYSYELDVQETKKVRQARAVFDHKKEEVRYWEKLYSKKDGLKKIDEVWPLHKNAQNAFSAQFFMRTLDFSDKKPKEIWITHNKENLKVVLNVMGEEKVKNKLGEFDCVIVKPTPYLKGKEKSMGEVLYWITKDERKIIVKIEAKIKIGSLKGEIQSLNF
ncbi:MAG: DUF3108 domain-containing protein [Bdellovibrionales bacterium]|nr:DUF3108 domain-containing protein [Bdellovibrionales bacterium]